MRRGGTLPDPPPKTVDHLRKHWIEGEPPPDMTDRRCSMHSPLSVDEA
jgi:hypothetical protein